jgi:hypothetical protein
MDWGDNPLTVHFARSLLGARSSMRDAILELTMGAIVAAVLIEMLMRAVMPEMNRLLLFSGATGLVAGAAGTLVTPLRFTRLKRSGVIDALRVTPLLGREIAWGVITPILLGNLVFWILLLVILAIRCTLIRGAGEIFKEPEIDFSLGLLAAHYGLMQCALASALTLKLCLRGHSPFHACALSALWLMALPWAILLLMIGLPIVLELLFQSTVSVLFFFSLLFPLIPIVVFLWQVYKAMAITGIVEQAGDELMKHQD